jgi:hypothetical protein
MRALQLHYTSCRHGQSGSPGFQVRALSPGIRPDEQREIERRGVYRPPRGAPVEPTPQQVARDFPTAFRSYPLESGRRALTLSCYTGRDYSGRWGNFFAHTLVLEGENGDAGRWPIDYYEWEGWCHGLDPTEDDGDEPPVLAPVDLGEAPPAESFRLAELQQFLAEEPGRRELLARMGRAVLLGRESSRPLVIRADALDGPYWIACILKLFPPRHAWDLSCSTYQDEPRGAAVINATVHGTDFAFSEAERSYQFYMFEPADGVASEVPTHDADYPALAARWLAETPETLDAFFGFLQRFRPFSFDAGELLAAADLFRAARGEETGFDGRRLAELLDFADRRATAEGRVALLEELGEILLSSADPGELAGDGGVLRFLAQAADATGQPPHRLLAFKVWLRWLESSLAASGSGLEALDRGWRDLLEILRDYRKDLATELLEPESFRRCAVHFGSLGPEPLGWLLGRVRESLELTGRSPFWKQPETRALMTALTAAGPTESAAELAFRQVSDDAEALAGVCLELLRVGAHNSPERVQIEQAVGRALGKVLVRDVETTTAARTVAQSVRRHLEASQGWEVLYGEWLFRLADAQDPATAFADYDREVLEALPRYRETSRGRVVRSLLETLQDDRAAAQAAQWLQTGEVDTFPGDLQETCVTLANRRVSLDLDNTASTDLAARVAERAQRLRLRLHPNHPMLRRLLQEIRDGGTPPRVQGDELKAALEEIGAESYRRFLEGFLQPYLETARTYSQHRACLLAVYRESQRSAFTDVYREFYRVKRTVRALSPLQAGLKFWLFFDPVKGSTSALAPIERDVQREIVHGLSRLPPKSLRELQRRLEKARLSVPAMQRWRQIEGRVEKRSTGLLHRLFGRGQSGRRLENQDRKLR